MSETYAFPFRYIYNAHFDHVCMLICEILSNKYYYYYYYYYYYHHSWISYKLFSNIRLLFKEHTQVNICQQIVDSQTQ